MMSFRVCFTAAYKFPLKGETLQSLVENMRASAKAYGMDVTSVEFTQIDEGSGTGIKNVD